MATLTGLFIADSYKALLKTIDNDVLGAAAKEIVDGYGNVSGVLFDTSGNVTINGNFRALDAILDSSGNAGTAGQVLTTTGTTTQWQSLSSVSGVTGSGTAGYLPLWSTNSALTNSIAIQSGTTITIGGTLTATTKINTPILQLTGGSGSQGTLSWNADEETVDLVQNGATLQLGQEIQIHVKNQTGATIPDGAPVRAAGTLGASGRILIAPMIADGSMDAKYFLGVTTEAIADGEEGKVTTFGKIRGINTAAYTEGQTLWVSATTAGAFTTTRPVAPNLDLEVAIVINSHVNNGVIFVRATNGHYLGTAHDVNISSVAENDLLVYKTNRWVNTKTIGDLTAANVTLSGYLRGPATFVIDPAAYGDETGMVQILGDLRVDGTTTTINSTTISVSDKNITLAKDAATAGDANGAGITIAGASATLTYLSATDDFTFNKNVNASRFVGPLTGNVTGTVSTLSNHDTDDLAEGTTNLYFTTARARDAFSAGTGVSIASGVISIGQSVGTTADVTFNSVTADLIGNADTATKLAAAVNIALTGSVTGNANFDGSGNISIATTTNHNHDDRYYTETEVGNFFSGATAITGYNKTNWDAAYNDKINSAAFNTGTGVITLTQQDAGTVTVDIDGRFLPLTGGTLTGALTIDDKLTITGTNNNLVIDETAANTWAFYDTFQNNGIILYSGSGGMEFQYNGVTQMTINGAGITFSGTLSFTGGIGTTDSDIEISTTGTATRGITWIDSGVNAAKIVSAGADDGKVTVFTNLSDSITGGAVFEVKEGSLGTTVMSVSDTGIITASLNGNASTATTATTANTLTTARTINGVSFDGSANITVTANTPNTLTRGTYLTGSNFNGSAATTWAVDATSANTASKVVARDASGNFSAGTITASLSGNATTATSAATWTTARSITLTGDVTGTVASVNGSANISIATTIAANSVALGTDTTGNYVGDVTAGAGISIGGSAGEGTSRSIGLIAADLTLFPTSNFKKSVKAATIANITLSAAQTIDGISCVSGDRVLVKDQTTAAENGIYIVAAGAWTRSTAADGSNEIDNAIVAVDQGTTNGGQYYTNTFKTTDVVGTTAMPWYRIPIDAPGYTYAFGISGNAGSATILQTTRTINGVNFNGSANITITANTPQTLTRGTYLTGSNFNGGTATTWAVDATSANTASKVVARDASGNFSAGTITATLSGNASTATTATSATSAATLTTARTINGTSFNGSANITTANWGTARTINGTSINGSTNYTTANWGTARTINGVSINGSTNYTIEPYVERDDTSNATRYLTFVDDATAAYKRLNMDNTLNYNPSTGFLTATSFVGGLVGNANTATTLINARTINGTSFNGSANITTASWGTSRNLTIGSATKAVNGSANVSFTLAEIGIAPGSASFPDLTNKDAGTGSYITSGDFRAPIFYDSAATTYYLDPNSFSNLFSGRFNSNLEVLGTLTYGAFSTGTNGYTRLPNGFILQWGRYTQTGSSATYSFPLVFPTACLGLWATKGRTSTAATSQTTAAGVGLLSTSQFYLDSNDAGGTGYVTFILAIGY